MPETWSACPCCTGPEPSHVLITAHDLDSDEDVQIRVPYAHRHTSVGWNDAERIEWDGDDGPRRGLKVAEGRMGITVRDEDGVDHRLDRDTWRTFKPKALRKGVIGRLAELGIRPLRKAAKKLKPGQRWITVHPNGKDEKGVPVLISENPDGTHSIIGGAGGKLTHLRLKNIKSEEEYAEQAKAKGKERREKEKERKAARTEEQAGAEKKAKADVEAAKLMAERKFISSVREKVGGVSEDIDEEKLQGLSDGAKNLILSRHHKKQLREAVERKDELARKLVEDRSDREKNRTAISNFLQRRLEAAQDPNRNQVAALAETELELQQREAEERRAERRARKSRQTAGQTKVGEKAAKRIAEVIENAPEVEERLKALGGRDDDPGRGDVLKVVNRASEEVERRSLQALDDAKTLLAAAQGEELDAEKKKVVEKALDKLGVKPDDERAEEALMREASRAMRRHEVQKARAERFREIEADPEQGGEAGAERALAFSDQVGQIAKDASEAKKLGLTETDKVPLQDAEIAEIAEVLADANNLRKAKREFQAMNKAAENGDYDRSRRAFDIAVETAPEEVLQSVEEDVRQQLAQQLRGMANQKAGSFLQSVSSAHYDSLADVGLGIGGQRYIDRPTVDALGVGNAAMLMRHALEADGHSPADLLTTLEEHHVGELNRITTDAIAKADEFVPELSTTVTDVGSLEEALVQLDAHELDLADAQRAVGNAIGRMEATATMGQTFRQSMPEHMEVDAGEDLGGTLQWLHAIGLKPDDYKVNYKDKTVQIPRGSWDKMLNREDPTHVERRKVVADIKAGKQDEAGWLPEGIVSREASTFTRPPASAPRYFQELDLSQGLGSLDDHVGSRLAEGEQPHEILSDLLAPTNVDSAPNRNEYLARVKELFPLIDEEGKARKYEEFEGHFQSVAEDFMKRKYGDVTGAFHAQDIGVDDPNTHEAMFRTLAKHPHATVAYKPTGELTPQDRRVLRDRFYERMGIDPKVRVDQARFEREFQALGPEPDPEAGTMSMFGGGGPSPEWKDWARRRDAVLAKYPRAGLQEAIDALGERPKNPEAAADHDAKVEALKQAASKAPTAWGQYVEAHGSLELAFKAMQDEVRHDFTTEFAEQHGRLTGRGLRKGVQEITNRERHVRATASPEEIERMKAEAQSIYAKLRQRVGGKFAAEGEGALKGKMTEWLEEDTIGKQNQASFFTAAQVQRKEKEPGTGERWSLGERAEQQIASLMPHIGRQFEAGKPVDLFPGLSMDGTRVDQQRVIKTLQANGGRLGGFLGVGSGKSLISIGAFTDAHAKGEATHGLYLVPAAVQDQFGGEMLRYTEPGRYRWETGSGKSHAERVEMLKNPDVHMRVMTHQAFRDTALQIMADHHGVDRDTMLQRMRGADPHERADMMRTAFDAAGIPRHMTYVDEAHTITHREGTEPSSLHLVGAAVSHPTNASHAIFGTGTPAKNDESEVYSMAAMIDPHKYADRHEFMQSFGDLSGNPDAIRRELSAVTYSSAIPPQGVDRHDSDNPRIENGRKVAQQGPLKLNDKHREHVDRVKALYDRARAARNRGDVDVDAMRELSPGRFESAPKSEHEQIARDLQDSLGIIRESAMKRAINRAPAEFNTKLQALADVVEHDLKDGTYRTRDGELGKGKPSIIFSNSLEDVKLIHDHLKERGIRAAMYHGGLNPKERDAVRLGFQPEGGGEPKYDVVVATSAAEAGINMQRAKAVHHYDVPETEKAHNQRSGRAFRQGQEGDVDVHNWHTDTDYETRARRRLTRKEGLASVLQSRVGSLDEHGIAARYQQVLERKHQATEQ